MQKKQKEEFELKRYQQTKLIAKENQEKFKKIKLDVGAYTTTKVGVPMQIEPQAGTSFDRNTIFKLEADSIKVAKQMLAQQAREKNQQEQAEQEREKSSKEKRQQEESLSS